MLSKKPYNHLVGEQAFRNYSHGRFTNKFHPAIFDAVIVAFYEANIKNVKIPKIEKELHVQLLKNDEFKKVISERTTDVNNIKKRIEMVNDYLIKGEGNEA